MNRRPSSNVLAHLTAPPPLKTHSGPFPNAARLYFPPPPARFLNTPLGTGPITAPSPPQLRPADATAWLDSSMSPAKSRAVCYLLLRRGSYPVSAESAAEITAAARAVRDGGESDELAAPIRFSRGRLLRLPKFFRGDCAHLLQMCGASAPHL